MFGKDSMSVYGTCMTFADFLAGTGARGISAFHAETKVESNPLLHGAHVIAICVINKVDMHLFIPLPLLSSSRLSYTYPALHSKHRAVVRSSKKITNSGPNPPDPSPVLSHTSLWAVTLLLPAYLSLPLPLQSLGRSMVEAKLATAIYPAKPAFCSSSQGHSCTSFPSVFSL